MTNAIQYITQVKLTTTIAHSYPESILYLAHTYTCASQCPLTTMQVAYTMYVIIFQPSTVHAKLTKRLAMKNNFIMV